MSSLPVDGGGGRVAIRPPRSECRTVLRERGIGGSGLAYNGLIREGRIGLFPMNLREVRFVETNVLVILKPISEKTAALDLRKKTFDVKALVGRTTGSEEVDG